MRDLLDCWPLRLKDKHFIAMSLKDKTPCENRKMLNWPRVFKCSQYQKYCCKIFTSFSLCLMIFSLCHARHVFGSCYAHFVPVTGLRGTKHVTWHVMWGYGITRKTCAWVLRNISRHHKMKNLGAKNRLGKKIEVIILVLATFKTFGQFNIFSFNLHVGLGKP